MATPNYKGQGQPGAASSGWLGALFGTQTPAYKSAAAQPAAVTSPSASTSGTTGSATASAAAPSASAMGCDSDAPPQIAIVIPREVIER